MLNEFIGNWETQNNFLGYGKCSIVMLLYLGNWDLDFTIIISHSYTICHHMKNTWQVASLGNGGDHVLDAISQCEQINRDQDGKEGHAPWRLFFRKEMFSPWENGLADAVACNLIFAQIIRGIMLGEYICDKVRIYDRYCVYQPCCSALVNVQLHLFQIISKAYLF